MEKAIRENQGKPKWSLVHYKSLEPMIRVLEYGMNKYEKDNWKKEMSLDEIQESLQRHIASVMDGETNDVESKILHMGHIMCNAMFWIYHYEKRLSQFSSDWKKEIEFIPSIIKEEVSIRNNPLSSDECFDILCIYNTYDKNTINCNNGFITAILFAKWYKDHLSNNEYQSILIDKHEIDMCNYCRRLSIDHWHTDEPYKYDFLLLKDNRIKYIVFCDLFPGEHTNKYLESKDPRFIFINNDMFKFVDNKIDFSFLNKLIMNKTKWTETDIKKKQLTTNECLDSVNRHFEMDHGVEQLPTFYKEDIVKNKIDRSSPEVFYNFIEKGHKHLDYFLLLTKEFTMVTTPKLNRIIEKRKLLIKAFRIRNRIYTCVDNSTGDAWVEDFNNPKDAYEWLSSSKSKEEIIGTHGKS